jgi:hypothetical protein
MSELESKVSRAIRAHGTRRVAEVLNVSREAALSLAVGVAQAGTVALASPHISKLDELR